MIWSRSLLWYLTIFGLLLVGFAEPLKAQGPDEKLRQFIDLFQEQQRRATRKESKQNSPPAGIGESPYVVGGVRLGEQIGSQTAAYKCDASDQFSGFMRCTLTERQSGPRGEFSTTRTFLYSQGGRVAYVNHHINPAFFDGTDIDAALAGMSRRFGARPHVMRRPGVDGTPEGIIATWGQVKFASLDASATALLASGQNPKSGMLVDYQNDLIQSARRGLPVYRLEGGSGFVWVASFDRSGKGRLRFFAIDSTVLVSNNPNNPERLILPEVTEYPSSTTREPEPAEVSDVPSQKGTEEPGRVVEVQIAPLVNQATYEEQLVELLSQAKSSSARDTSNPFRHAQTQQGIADKHKKSQPPPRISRWKCNISQIGVEVYSLSDRMNAQEHIGFNPSGNEYGVRCASKVEYLLVFNPTPRNFSWLATLNVGQELTFDGFSAGRRYFDMLTIVRAFDP